MRFSSVVFVLLVVGGQLAVTAQAPPDGQGRKAALEKFDANGDGRLDAEERKAAQEAVGKALGGREAVMKRFDTNGNGKIDPDEREAIRKAMAQNKVGPAKAGQPRKPGVGQDRPRLSREEMMKKFDTNGNGQIDPEERAAIRKEMAGKVRPGQGQRPDQPKPGQRPSREEILKKFDANGNGQIDPEERAAIQKEMAGRVRPGQGQRPGQPAGPGNRPSREEILKKFDANNNGRLDPPELAKLRETMGRRPEGQRPDRPGTGNKPSDKPNVKPNGQPGAPNGARMLDRLPPQVKQRLLEQFDANKNGELEPAEFAKAREAMGNRGPGGGNRAGFGLNPNQATLPTLDQTELLEQFDANNNGKLDASEQAAAARKLRAGAK